MPSDRKLTDGEWFDAMLDDEVEKVMSTSNAELRQAIIDEGEDPDEVARQLKAQISKMMYGYYG